MHFLFYILPILILIPTGIYLYFFFARILKLIFGKESRLIKGLSAAAAVACIYFAWPAYGWGGVAVLHLVGVSLVMELVNFFVRKVSGSHRKWEFIYKSGILVFAVIAVIFSYGYYNMHQIKRTDYHISSEKISGGNSLKIALVSDIHLGVTMNAEELKSWCDKIQSQQPDMVLLAGDIFDEDTKRSEMERASEIFGDMKSTYGVFYVLGNHDPNKYKDIPEYYPKDMKKALTKAGVRVLEDEAVPVGEDIYVVGRKDASDESRKSLKEVMEDVPDDALTVLMDHQPGDLAENNSEGIDLQVSGHTHAGQIWPTGQLMQFLRVNEINYGYRRTGKLQTIVTSGLAGWGYPIRTGGHCEYVMIDVVPEK